MGVETTIGQLCEVTDFVANGSFKALRDNVHYLTEPSYAVLVRLVDYNSNWRNERVFVSESSYCFLRKSSLLPGDVIIANVGANVGTVFRAPKLQKPMTLGPNAIMCRPKDNASLDRTFFFYMLRSSYGQGLIRSIISGSAQPKFNKTDFRNLVVTIPTIEVQRYAANFLSSLDDRIDLLRQTNTTLESIAQALFKSWFVDFDPVHTKSEGRAPEAMDAATAALFPSEFEQSELGLIPKGWRMDEVGNAVKCLGGGTPSTKEDAYWTGGEFHWVTPKDLSGLQAPVLTTTDRKITSAGLSRISSGLLPVGTLLMSSRAPIGYLALTSIPTAINQGFIAMPPDGALPPLYLFFWARKNMDLIKQAANGSTFMEISKKAFRPIKLCIPPPELVDAFVSIASPLMSRIEANEHHRVMLAELRDTLLPRLISGKLCLSDIEVAAVVAETAG